MDKNYNKQMVVNGQYIVICNNITKKAMKILVLEITDKTILYKNLDAEPTYTERLLKTIFDLRYTAIEFIGLAKSDCPMSDQIEEYLNKYKKS